MDPRSHSKFNQILDTPGEEAKKWRGVPTLLNFKNHKTSAHVRKCHDFRTLTYQERNAEERRDLVALPRLRTRQDLFQPTDENVAMPLCPESRLSLTSVVRQNLRISNREKLHDKAFVQHILCLHSPATGKLLFLTYYNICYLSS